jgi:CubicO group peptidase (beta-lactamase class C family)
VAILVLLAAGALLRAEGSLGLRRAPWEPPEREVADISADAAARYSRAKGGDVLIISMPGMPDFRAFSGGRDPRTPMPVFSITKSLAALACLSLGRPAPDDVVLRRAGGAITLRQLLSQTSGIAPGYGRLYSKSLRDVRAAAASLPLEHPPGQHFDYGPSHFELLGGVLPGNGGPPPPVGRFLARLGILPSGWRTDPKGQAFFSAGAVLTPEDLLKLGRFVLGRARSAKPPGRFAEAFVGSRANPAYGLGFWLNRAAGTAVPRDIEEAIGAGLTGEQWSQTCLSNLAPPDLICMAGSGGQRVYVIPSLRTVVVRLGRPAAGFRDPDFLHALFSPARG